MSSTSSSLSLAPAAVSGVTRTCTRLAHPDPRTIENYTSGVVNITVWLPFDIVNKYAPMIGNYGLDNLVINFTDYLGQSNQISRLVTFWASDEGWIFLSADQGTQFLIANVIGSVYDTNAAAINARNTSSSVSSLKPCGDQQRYDYPRLLCAQTRPSSAFIRDGLVVTSGTYT